VIKDNISLFVMQVEYIYDYIGRLTNWITDPRNTEYVLLILLIIGTVLTPIIIYTHQRSKIPKLKFDGFVKVASPDRRLGDKDIKGITGYFLKVKNANRRSEGKVDCQGFIIVGIRTYRTVWHYDYAETPIGQEELLLLFYMNNNDKTVNFANYHRYSKVIELSKPYDKCANDNISIRLECSSGSCPKPLTKSIKNIIDKATTG
jgi:hypothetical protein